MKGIIFTEFLDIVERTFDLEVCQSMLDMANEPGVYTSVGSYEHQRLVKLIICLHKVTGVSPENLQQTFGRAVFPRLLTLLPNYDFSDSNTFDFIRSVESYIHQEVKKLYPDTTPPRFEFSNETETTLTMDYHSARCMGYVCLGLLEGCADYFEQHLDIALEPTTSKNCVRFHLSLSDN